MSSRALGGSGRRPPVARTPTSRRFLRGGLVFDLALLLLALSLLAAPRLLEGLAALEWTRHHAWVGTSLRPAERARQASLSAVLALDRLAPLPGGAEAAGLALEVGRRLSARERVAALGLAHDLRVTIERLRASRVRGLGLQALLEEARRLEEETRSAGGDEPR